jgi:hypothetical protein
MITQFEALELVSRALQNLTTPENPFVVLSAETIEKPFGWIFFYNSKRFLESGAFRDRLAGPGPIVVHRADGKVELVGVSSSWTEFIEKYERRFAQDVDSSTSIALPLVSAAPFAAPGTHMFGTRGGVPP